VDPADRPRFAELGVIATVQPQWAQTDAVMTELTIPRLGPGRAERQYPFATLARLGRADAGIAAYGKLALSGLTAARARAGLEIGGADAVTWPAGEDGVTAHAFLESKKPSIAGGTEQMQRNGIAERVLGLPREPAVDVDLPFGEVLRRAPLE